MSISHTFACVTDTLDSGMDAPRRGASLRASSDGGGLHRGLHPGEDMLRRVLRGLIRSGGLRVTFPPGAVETFGPGAVSVAIRTTRSAVIRRLLRNPHLALGEAYMDGALRLETGDIYALLALCLTNMSRTRASRPQRLMAAMRRFCRQFAPRNTARRARANVAHHYDPSDALYALFLDPDRQYSCAYYRSPDDSLEDAQARKKAHLAAKLRLAPGQRVLDIGSGWGGLALYLARESGADVTEITLSTKQYTYATRRAEAAGLSERVRFELRDYRAVTRRYDRIVSVRIFEHVGAEFYTTFFRCIRDRLTDDGIAVVHTIGSADNPGAVCPWIAKYIFPGGYIPALSEIVPAIERLGLYITDIEVLRLHYAETLKEWRRRFMQNRERALALYDEQFCRMWEFYLAGCEAAFRHNGLVVFQMQLARRIDTVPMTRDYIFESEAGAGGQAARDDLDQRHAGASAR